MKVSTIDWIAKSSISKAWKQPNNKGNTDLSKDSKKIASSVIYLESSKKYLSTFL